MIKSFRDREAERIFNEQRSRKLPSAIQRTALRKLVQLDSAVTTTSGCRPATAWKRLETVW